MTDPRRGLVGGLAAAGACVAAGAAVGGLGLGTFGLPPLWPPAGIALAAAFLGGWPAVLPVAAALAGLAWEDGLPLGPALLVVAGQLASATVGAALLRRIGLRPQLDRTRDAVILGLVGAGLAPLLAAVGAAAALVVAGRAPEAAAHDVAWAAWIGDATGVLVFTPLVFVWRAADGFRWSRLRMAEMGVSALATLAVTVWVFFGKPPGAAARAPQAFLTFPLLLWAAIRFPPRLTFSRLAFVGVLAVIGMAVSDGSFAGEAPGPSPRDIETFLVVSALGTLLVGTTVAEARREASERSAAVAELAASRSVFDRFMTESPLSAFLKDADGRYVFANARWEEGLGKGAAHPWRGRTDGELFPQAEARHFGEHDAAVREAGEGKIFLENLVREGVEETWLAARFPVRGRGGEGLLGGMAVDVTAQKAAAERQRELEGRLEQVQRMEALGVLAGGVAHDFNNLLAVVVTNGEVVARDATGPSAAAAAEILRAAARARELVQRILLFSRRADVRRVAVSVGEVARESRAFLRATLPATVELDLVVAEDLPEVTGDPAELGRVFVNLAANAAQAQGGRGVVRIRVDAVTGPEGRRVQVRVMDEGHGMDARTRARIFEPFFTTRDAGSGTGLGLAVVHGIVGEHGGAIEVESAPGRGTTVIVTLPARTEGPAEQDPSPPPRPTAAPLRILLVDDESLLLTAMSRALRLRGYDVAAFADPVAALAAVRAHPSTFDILVTDLTMPGMTGLELAEHANAIRPDLPVVVATGFAADVDPAELRAFGVRTVLTKPFTVGELERVMATEAGPPPS